MSQKQFWSGVSVGAGAVLGAVVAANLRASRPHSRVIRVERSVQVGADLPAVFRAWSHFDRIPQYCRYITHVRNTGPDCSEWTANIDGRVLHWEAEITQVIPDQVIGWKSISGPKHSGRIIFGRIGSDTLVHVQMNYEPSALARPMMSSMQSQLANYVEAALRDFKAEMESLEHESEIATDSRESAELLPPNVTIGNFGGRRSEGKGGIRRSTKTQAEATGTLGRDDANPVEYTRPPEDSSLHNE